MKTVQDLLDKDDFINDACKKAGYKDYFEAHKKADAHELAEIIYSAMHQANRYCLLKAADNAVLKEKEHPGEWGEEIDKDSITSEENLI